MLKTITNLKKFINNRGGVTYLKINQINKNKLLQGKNIIITGGSSGIGYEIAKKIIDLGGNVLITGRNKEHLEKVKKELNCKILLWDIEDVLDSSDKIKQILNIFNNKIDCLINNAGIYTKNNILNCDIQTFEKIINTNLKGLYFITKEMIQQCFLKQNYGNIIMISSIEAINKIDGPYAISKEGIINLTKSLARNYQKDNIRINAIAPGMTCSNINKINDKENLYREYLKGKRIISAQEIAEVAIFLISDASKSLNGEILTCDNGENL